VIQEPKRVRGVTITTPQRVVYPALDFTKLDLARFYDDVSRWMLPYVRSRPLTLVRCERGVSKPDALRSECKFLRHTEGWHRWAGPSLRKVHIPEQKKVGEYLVVESAESLVALVQGDVLEIHVWNTTIDHVEQPDQLVFDLDPAPDVGWPRLVEAAELLRERLLAIGLESWPRLTGGKGIHVVVPFVPELGWEIVYSVARIVAESMVRDEPAVFTTAFSKAMRSGKILVDYKRNHRAATAIASYSARARPTGTVATPVSWKELGQLHEPPAFTVKSLCSRLRRRKRDPWEGFSTTRQRLSNIALRKSSATSNGQ
jgi:bifunctional non-homologous end joining protein LigD